jgi:hypothetical protein
MRVTYHALKAQKYQNTYNIITMIEQEQKQRQQLNLKIKENINNNFQELPIKNIIQKINIKSETIESLNDLFNSLNKLNVKTLKNTKNSKNSNSIKKLLAMRNQLVEWLTIVAKMLKQSDYTLFRTISLIDNLIIKYEFSISPEDLHLIALVCFFISSKYEEIKPLKIKIIQKNVAHDKYSKEDLILTEKVLLKKINFKFEKIILFDAIYLIISSIIENMNRTSANDLEIENINSNNNKINSKDYNNILSFDKQLLIDNTIKIAKMLLLDFKFSLKLLNSKTFTFALVYFTIFENNDNVNQCDNKFIILNKEIETYYKNNYLKFVKNFGISSKEVLDYSNEIKSFIFNSNSKKR